MGSQLKLTVSSADAASLGSAAAMSFWLRGGTIGRTRDNDWVLPDPERIVSSHHARIQYEHGTYYIVDTSSNGTYLNQIDTPLPQGRPISISHGDILYIGQYEIQVELIDEALRPTDSGRRIELEPSEDADFVAKPYYPEARAGYDSEGRQTPPPLDREAPWHDHADTPTADSTPRRGVGAESDHLPADRHSFRPPAAAPELIPEDVPPPVVEALPDDWWKTDDEPSPEPGRAGGSSDRIAPPGTAPTAASDAAPGAPAIEAEPPVVSREQLPPTTFPHATGTAVSQQPPSAAVPPTPPPGGSAGASAEAAANLDAGRLLAAFFDGLGLDAAATASVDAEALLRDTGRLLRLLTQRTIEVLQARSSLKGEFRLSQTVVRPVENNPLKFSLDADQALRQFYLEKRSGFLGPGPAFAEALQDIKQHEIAVIAGMRAAFNCLMNRFAPETIEAALRSQGRRGSRLPFGDRTWAFYQAYYSEFKANAGDDFQGIFGQDFVRAYEEQIDLLQSKKESR